jgi:hypothetical protein
VQKLTIGRAAVLLCRTLAATSGLDTGHGMFVSIEKAESF